MNEETLPGGDHSDAEEAGNPVILETVSRKTIADRIVPMELVEFDENIEPFALQDSSGVLISASAANGSR
jgi:hypothetical protein